MKIDVYAIDQFKYKIITIVFFPLCQVVEFLMREIDKVTFRFKYFLEVNVFVNLRFSTCYFNLPFTLVFSCKTTKM